MYIPVWGIEFDGVRLGVLDHGVEARVNACVLLLEFRSSGSACVLVLTVNARH